MEVAHYNPQKGAPVNFLNLKLKTLKKKQENQLKKNPDWNAQWLGAVIWSQNRLGDKETEGSSRSLVDSPVLLPDKYIGADTNWSP